MGLSLPKQYARMGSKTMLEHSIDALLAAPVIEHIVVVVAANDEYWRQLPASNKVTFAPVGAASRAGSVRAGLQTLAAARDDWAVVHDAARPCLSTTELQCLLADAQDEAIGRVLALPLADTLKRARDGLAYETVPRDGLWRALTPQMIRAGALQDALDAIGDLAMVTDEAAALEQGGHYARLVAGQATNIKVTAPADWTLAEAILRAQGRW